MDKGHFVSKFIFKVTFIHLHAELKAKKRIAKWPSGSQLITSHKLVAQLQTSVDHLYKRCISLIFCMVTFYYDRLASQLLSVGVRTGRSANWRSSRQRY